jgi:hypothetical protein
MSTIRTHTDSIRLTARSAEPGADWSWCYLDRVAFVVSRS